MTSTQGPFLNTSIYLPDDDDTREIYLTSLFKDIAIKNNLREIGTYETFELITGQRWFNNNNFNDKKSAYRLVVVFPTIAGPGTTSVPHELGDISGFTFTRIYGTAKNAAGTLHVPLPQASLDNVMITVDANNVNIICGTATYNTFYAQVILEYLKN